MTPLKKMQRVIVFFLITGLASCESSDRPEPDTELDNCEEYSCPVHKDNVFIASETCPECGLQMVRKHSLDSLLSQVESHSIDSLKLFHKLMIEQSDRVLMNDSTTKDEKIKAIREAAKNLNKTKAIHENPDRLTSGKQIMPIKPQSDKLTRLYAAATYRINAISSELAKQNPDQRKVKLYSSELREIIIEIDQRILPKKNRLNP